jgi:hypothetical protein
VSLLLLVPLLFDCRDLILAILYSLDCDGVLPAPCRFAPATRLLTRKAIPIRNLHMCVHVVSVIRPHFSLFQVEMTSTLLHPIRAQRPPTGELVRKRTFAS